MLNFNDPRSKLFFEYVRLLREVKPRYFLLENVKMKKEWQDIISRELWVEPIEINSSLVSAQSRKRLYRTNIPNITQPKDKGILLKDILQDEVDEKYYYSAERWNKILSWKYDIVKRLEDAEKKSNTLTTVGWGNHEKKILVSHCPASREFDGQWFKEDKSPTLCARDYKDPKVAVELISVRGGEVRVKQATKQWYIVANDGDGISLAYPNSTTRRGRVIHQKSNTLTTWSDAHVLLKNKDIIVWNQFNNRVFTDKSGTIWTCAGRTNKQGMWLYYKEVKPQYYIRKLTPIEYERLQTLEDNYTAGVSDTQRYKMLGNGWTVDVVAHIFRSIPS